MKNDSESEASKATEKTAGKKEAKQETASASLVKFDPEGITDRIIKLPLSASYYANFYSNGKKVYYWSNGGTKFFDLEGQKEETVADGAMMTVTRVVKRLCSTRTTSFM